MDTFSSRPEPYRLVQNEGSGLLIQGGRDWVNYKVEADITPHLVKRAGVAGRLQGMRRYYSLVLNSEGELCLNKMLNEETCLAKTSFDWSFGETYHLALAFDGKKLTGMIDGEVKLEATDEELNCGGVGLFIEEGRSATQEVRVLPLS